MVLGCLNSLTYAINTYDSDYYYTPKNNKRTNDYPTEHLGDESDNKGLNSGIFTNEEVIASKPCSGIRECNKKREQFLRDKGFASIFKGTSCYNNCLKTFEENFFNEASDFIFSDLLNK